jgi:hypothetical protein
MVYWKSYLHICIAVNNGSEKVRINDHLLSDEAALSTICSRFWEDVCLRIRILVHVFQ